MRSATIGAPGGSIRTTSSSINSGIEMSNLPPSWHRLSSNETACLPRIQTRHVQNQVVSFKIIGTTANEIQTDSRPFPGGNACRQFSSVYLGQLDRPRWFDNAISFVIDMHTPDFRCGDTVRARSGSDHQVSVSPSADARHPGC